jgi:hypothetical protein
LAFGEWGCTICTGASHSHHALHLFQELALARLLGRQVQAKSELLHRLYRRSPWLLALRRLALSYATPSLAAEHLGQGC